jgi:hypothetical protein
MRIFSSLFLGLIALLYSYGTICLASRINCHVICRIFFFFFFEFLWNESTEIFGRFQSLNFWFEKEPENSLRLTDDFSFGIDHARVCIAKTKE